jgi:hypothetical protein
MTPFTCSRLQEVRQALADGHWPQASPTDLRAHVDTCPRCAQEILITQHLQQSRATAIPGSQPGSASLLWWRAQTRRRHAALERAGRPIAAAQIFAFIIAVTAIIGVVAAHWRDLIASAQTTPALSFTTILSDWGLAPIVIAIAAITTLGGVALYLTTERH